MNAQTAPIFVGGTGRSGTTIMGKFLDSHESVVTPVNENKLIVEPGGLRSLVENLSDGYDFKGNHYAICNFIQWARTLRSYGFSNSAASFVYRATNKLLFFSANRKIPPAKVCRAFPWLDFSLIGIGEKYGLPHYDRCLEQFLANVIGEIDAHGVVVAEGLIKQVYAARTLDREELLECAREFLNALNAKKIRETGAARWCDDTPLNARYSKFLLELFPAGKVVHMVRDPRDVAASYSERSWASGDLEMTLNRLNRQYRELIKLEENLPKQSFRTFRLEDFTTAPDRQKHELCRFLEMDPGRFDGSVEFEASSFGRWKEKFGGNTVELVEKRLEEVCAHFGYS